MEEITAGPSPQRWTEERMFDRSFDGERFGMRRYTDEFREARDKEMYWKQVADRPNLTWEQGRLVGLGEQTCPLCDGKRYVYVMFRGEVTGIEMERQVDCFCQLMRRFWDGFKRVDSRFRDAHLGVIEPSKKVSTPIERQAEIISKLKAHPGDSYLFVGPPGGGKTFLAAALFQRAVLESVSEQMAAHDLYESVWWASTSVLLNEHVDWEREEDREGKDDPRYVTERKIKLCIEHGGRPRLFLDEIDKITVSDFKIRRLGELVNATYAAGGQVVATMNKSPDALAVKWKDEDEAATILRRIGSDGGHLIKVG